MFFPTAKIERCKMMSQRSPRQQPVELTPGHTLSSTAHVLSGLKKGNLEF